MFVVLNFVSFLHECWLVSTKAKNTSNLGTKWCHMTIFWATLVASGHGSWDRKSEIFFFRTLPGSACEMLIGPCEGATFIRDCKGNPLDNGVVANGNGGGGFFLSATSDQTGCQSPTTKLRWVLEDVDCLTVLWAMFQRGAMFDKRGDFCWWSDWKAVRVVTRSKPRQKLYVLGGYQARIKNGLPDRIGYGET